MRRIIGVLSITSLIIVLGACNFKDTADLKKEEQSKLTGKNWIVSYTKTKIDNLPFGFRFGKKGNLFYLDSQENTIFSQHGYRYIMKGDTLKLIDYRYRKRSHFRKGVKVFLIKEFTNNRLGLKMLHPDSNNYMVLKWEE